VAGFLTAKRSDFRCSWNASAITHACLQSLFLNGCFLTNDNFAVPNVLQILVAAAPQTAFRVGFPDFDAARVGVEPAGIIGCYRAIRKEYAPLLSSG